MSDRLTLERFFAGKLFLIPSYQRDYAWSQQNADDLLADIDETIETKTNHYIGTFILSKRDNRYSVVDGQQRLTTLTMLLNAVVRCLPDTARITRRDAYIYDETKKAWRLIPAEYNRDFFTSLLEGHDVTATSKSQRLLLAANRYIQERVQARATAHGGDLSDYLDALQQLEVMEFIEPDEGKAIRIFQTVNDRGRPLSIIEKTKSLLVYYSNRLLSGRLDSKINDLFGQMFRSFSALKEIGEHPDTRIDLIAAATFDEDSVLRYHFLSFPVNDDYYDFKPTIDSVLTLFLKPMLKRHRSDPQFLTDFIDTYITDLASFFDGLLALVTRVKTQPRYYNLFCFLNLSTHLYPLAVRLQRRKLLDQSVRDDSPLTFADVLEITDIRIYKSKSRDPVKDIAYLAREAVTEESPVIRRKLRQILKRFMSDSDFISILMGSDMYSNAALPHTLIRYGEDWANRTTARTRYSVPDLTTLKRSEPTIEHIFADEPKFNLPGRGFDDRDDYDSVNNSLGNLSVLEKTVNSRCQNRTPDDKFNDPNLLKASSVDVTRAIVAEVAASGQEFGKTSVEGRTKALAEWIRDHWPLWSED